MKLEIRALHDELRTTKEELKEAKSSASYKNKVRKAAGKKSDVKEKKKAIQEKRDRLLDDLKGLFGVGVVFDPNVESEKGQKMLKLLGQIGLTYLEEAAVAAVDVMTNFIRTRLVYDVRELGAT